MYNQPNQSAYQSFRSAYQPTGLVQSQYDQAQQNRYQANATAAFGQQSANQFHLPNYQGNQPPYNTNQYEQATIHGQQQYQQGGAMQQQSTNQFHLSNYKGNQPGYNVNQYFQPIATANQYGSAGQGQYGAGIASAPFGIQSFQSSATGQQMPLQSANQFHLSNYKGNLPGYNVNQYSQPTATANQNVATNQIAPYPASQTQQQNSLSFHQAGYQGNQQY